MGIYTRYISTIKAIDSIKVSVQNTLKDIVGVYVFVNGKRSLVWPDSKLIYTNATPGEFSFVVPDVYDYIYVEYAGAAGGRAWISAGDGINPDHFGGAGSIMGKNYVVPQDRIVSGIIGAMPTEGYNSEYIGGPGYNNGESSNRHPVTVEYMQGGGGGGSTAVIINKQVYEACAGGGASAVTAISPNVFGGKGGGIYGGIRQTNNDTNGNTATDPERRGNNTNNGYIKIWGVSGLNVKPADSI